MASNIKGVVKIQETLQKALVEAITKAGADEGLGKKLKEAIAHGIEGQTHETAAAKLDEVTKSFSKKASEQVVEQLKAHSAEFEKAAEVSVKETDAFTKALIKQLETNPEAFVKAESVEALVKETLATDKVIAETFEAGEETIKALAEKSKTAVPEAAGTMKQFGNWMARPFQRIFKGEAAELLEVTEANGKKILTPLKEQLNFGKAAAGVGVRAAVVGVPVILAGKMLFGGKSEPEASYTYPANENTPREGGFAAAEEARRAEAASAEFAR